MRDVAVVQQLPTEQEGSEDVLESLKHVLTADVYEQLEQRVALGVKKYGSRLKTLNGRDVRMDCRQELLDGIMYAQQGLLEGKIPIYIRNRFIGILLEMDTLERRQKAEQLDRES